MAKIYSYAKVSELPQIISSIHEENMHFVVPSRNDKILFPADKNNLWTWQEIYEDVCISTRKRVLSPPDHLLILKVLLRNAIGEFSDKALNLPGIARDGFLTVISEDIRELLNEAVKPEQLNNNPESNIPSEFLLPQVYARYVDYLDINNLLDSAQIYSEALKEILKNQKWGRDYTFIFTGFMSFNHAQLELLRALDDRCQKVIILKPEVNLQNYHDADIQFGLGPSNKTSNGKILEISSAEPGLEPEIIARTLALWAQDKFLYSENFSEIETSQEKVLQSAEQLQSEKFPGFDAIGLMISPGREDEFAQSFERYGINYDFMSGVSISQTLPGKILASIRNLKLRDFPAYETAMLLTQPCFAGLKFPVMRAYRAGCAGLDSWENYLASDENEDTFVDALCAIREIRKFCDALAGKKNPLQIMRAFHNFINAKNLWLDKKDTLADFQELDESRRMTAAAIKLIGDKVLALAELTPDLGPVQDEKIKNDDAYDYLEEWCRKTNIRAPLQVSDAVRIFTGSPPVLAAFPVWIMSSVTQKSWSETVTSSPLLSNSEREELHMPTISDKAAQREALFRRLIQTGEALTVISRPELDDEGRPVLESPFVQRFLDNLPDWTLKKAKSKGIKILLGNDGFIFPEIDAEEKIARFVPKIYRHSDAVGASDIHELLSCGFLWYQKRQAKLYEQDSEITSATEWGNMLHKFWECVWRIYREDMNSSGKNFVNIAKKEWKKLYKAEDETYAKFHRLVKDFRLQRKLRGIKFRVDRLRDIQANILDALHSQGFIHKKILLEEEAHLKKRVNSVTFLGQCDRVEILQEPDNNGECAFIVDYKEGVGEKSEAKMAISNYFWNINNHENFEYGLQLSVYATLFENSNLSGVYILGLEDGKISGSFSSETEKIFEKFKSKKFNTKLLERIEEGEYAMKCAAEILKRGEFMPEYSRSDMCRLCKIKSLCRKGEFRGEFLQDDNIPM